jgi:hypothetical protein
MSTTRDKQDQFKQLVRNLRLREGHWTDQNLRSALATLDMTQKELAALTGKNLRTASRWATGATPVPQTVAMLLQGLLDQRKHGWKAAN